MYYTGNYTVFQTKYLMILHRIGLQQQHYYTPSTSNILQVPHVP